VENLRRADRGCRMGVRGGCEAGQCGLGEFLRAKTEKACESGREA